MRTAKSVCSGYYPLSWDPNDNSSNIPVPTYLSESELLAIGTIFLVLGLFGIVGNCLVTCYYHAKREGVFSLYYYTITLCNLIMAADAIGHVVVIATYVSLDHDGIQISLTSDYLYLHEESNNNDDTHQSYKDKQLLINYMIFITYTLTSLVRNSKIVYNTILVAMRTVKYCSPKHVFSRKNSKILILTFPIVWMLFLAGFLHFDFSLSAEQNMQQFVYFPEPNPNIKLIILLVVYIIPTIVISVSLAVCCYKVKCKVPGNQKKKPRIEIERDTMKIMEVSASELSYGQHQNTDMYLTLLFLLCYFPYFILLIIDYHYEGTEKEGSIHCSIMLITGTLLPFVNSAVDPIIIMLNNKYISSGLRACFGGVKRHLTCIQGVYRGVRLEVELDECYHGSNTNRISLEKRKARVQERTVRIEYKDSDSSSNSSCDSIEIEAYRHKSRRYR